MESNIQSFVFQSDTVRVQTDDSGEPWWVAIDVCRVLGIANSSQALSRLDDDERDGVVLKDPLGREQWTAVINETGLYALVLSSRKPEAKQFKRWVTHEVLPSIRKTGSYQVHPSTVPEKVGTTEILRALLSVSERQDVIVERQDRVEVDVAEVKGGLQQVKAVAEEGLARESVNGAKINAISRDYGQMETKQVETESKIEGIRRIVVGASVKEVRKWKMEELRRIRETGEYKTVYGYPSFRQFLIHETDISLSLGFSYSNGHTGRKPKNPAPPAP